MQTCCLGLASMEDPAVPCFSLVKQEVKTLSRRIYGKPKKVPLHVQKNTPDMANETPGWNIKYTRALI